MLQCNRFVAHANSEHELGPCLGIDTSHGSGLQTKSRLNVVTAPNVIHCREAILFSHLVHLLPPCANRALRTSALYHTSSHSTIAHSATLLCVNRALTIGSWFGIPRDLGNCTSQQIAHGQHAERACKAPALQQLDASACLFCLATRCAAFCAYRAKGRLPNFRPVRIPARTVPRIQLNVCAPIWHSQFTPSHHSLLLFLSVKKKNHNNKKLRECTPLAGGQ